EGGLWGRGRRALLWGGTNSRQAVSKSACAMASSSGSGSKLALRSTAARSREPGFDLPHQYERNVPGRSFYFDFVGERRAHAVCAFRVPFEPISIVALPRVVQQRDRGRACAAPAPLDDGKQAVSVGDALAVSRKRFNDPLGGQLRPPVVRRQKIMLTIAIEPNPEDLGEAIEAAFAG